MKKLICLYFISSLIITSCNQEDDQVLLFTDDYSVMPRGPLGSDVGAHTEYHYLHEAKPKGNWAISTFRSNLPASWYVRKVNEKKVLLQNGVNKNNHWHPMVVAGDLFWENYTILTSFSSLDKEKQCGVVFRYNNDRCYYILGVRQDTAFLKMVKQATGYHKPFEKVLASEHFSYNIEDDIKVRIELLADQISASIESGPQFNVSDTTYKKGKIGFLADGPAYFNPVEITSNQNDKSEYEYLRREADLAEQKLIDNNPRPVLWKSIKTNDFGVGRNLRFGDLNGDGEIDVLIGQVVHHGHKDRNTELSCLTAMTFDGDILWQKGKPEKQNIRHLPH